MAFSFSLKVLYEEKNAQSEGKRMAGGSFEEQQAKKFKLRQQT
jgi:hypothetical protein